MSHVGVFVVPAATESRLFCQKKVSLLEEVTPFLRVPEMETGHQEGGGELLLDLHRLQGERVRPGRVHLQGLRAGLVARRGAGRWVSSSLQVLCWFSSKPGPETGSVGSVSEAGRNCDAVSSVGSSSSEGAGIHADAVEIRTGGGRPWTPRRGPPPRFHRDVELAVQALLLAEAAQGALPAAAPPKPVPSHFHCFPMTPESTFIILAVSRHSCPTSLCWPTFRGLVVQT